MQQCRPLILAACLSCSQAPGRAALPESPGSPATAAAAAPPAAPAVTLPEPPHDARCVLRAEVSRGDVAWKLRTRRDAVPTMQVEDARVTGFLRAGRHRHHPYALAEVENSSMLIRAFVGTEDLKVVVSKAYESLPGHFPDGFTHRQVLAVEDDKAVLSIDMEGATSTVSILDCNALALVGSDLGVERRLPPVRGEVVVKWGASVKTDGGFYGINAPGEVASPEGMLAELRGEDTDPLARRVSFTMCGGLVVGFVPKSELLGPPVVKVGRGANARCPNIGASVFVGRGPLARPVSCPREIPVFLRSDTLEDPVGILRAGAKFQVDDKGAGGTRLVWVEAPPAEPLEGFSFSVRIQDLGDCAPA